MNGVDEVTYAVGGTVSAKIRYVNKGLDIN